MIAQWEMVQINLFFFPFFLVSSCFTFLFEFFFLFSFFSYIFSLSLFSFSFFFFSFSFFSFPSEFLFSFLLILFLFFFSLSFLPLASAPTEIRILDLDPLFPIRSSFLVFFLIPSFKAIATLTNLVTFDQMGTGTDSSFSSSSFFLPFLLFSHPSFKSYYHTYKFGYTWSNGNRNN